MVHNATTFVTSIWLLLGVGAIVAGWQLALYPSLVEIHRQTLFALRRRLFLYMADGHVSADNEAYKQLRMRLNAMLEYAEEMTCVRLCLLWLLTRKRISDDFPQLCESLPSDVAEEFRSIRVEMGEAMILHFTRTSPVMWLILLVASFVLVIYMIAHGMHSCSMFMAKLALSVPIEIMEPKDSILHDGATLSPSACH